MTFWKFEILGECPGPIFHIPTNENGFENARPLSGSHFCKFPQKKRFEESQIWEQLSDFKSQLSATLMILFDINGKMDLEKLR